MISFRIFFSGSPPEVHPGILSGIPSEIAPGILPGMNPEIPLVILLEIPLGISSKIYSEISEILPLSFPRMHPKISSG